VAEVICLSPFSTAGSIDASFRVELLSVNSPDLVTWNPLDTYNVNVVLSNGNLTLSYSSDTEGSARSNRFVSKGKWYWEIKIDSDSSPYVHNIGISEIDGVPRPPGRSSGVHSYGFEEDGDVWYKNNQYSYGNSHGQGDTVGVALDLDNGKIWWAVNNVWQASGDPELGTSPAFTGISGSFAPAFGASYSPVITGRFKSSDQIYSPPVGFSAIELPRIFDPYETENILSVGVLQPGYIGLDEAFSAVASLSSAGIQQEIIAGALTATATGQANIQVEISGSALSAVSGFTCDHCFNYAQISAYAPTPTCAMSAVFRYARIDAVSPTPTASFTIGKNLVGSSPVPDFTCTAYHGRNPSLAANAPCPTCLMRVGLSLSDIATISRKAGVPVPTCIMTADTHHLTTIYGKVPVPTITCVGDTENIAVISATVPAPTGLFSITVGNVANILGRAPCPTCVMIALTGQVVKLAGNAPIPGDLVRFYASLKNDTITLAGTVPTPTMISCVSGLTSSILRHIRGEIR